MKTIYVIYIFLVSKCDGGQYFYILYSLQTHQDKMYVQVLILYISLVAKMTACQQELRDMSKREEGRQLNVVSGVRRLMREAGLPSINTDTLVVFIQVLLCCYRLIYQKLICVNIRVYLHIYTHVYVGIYIYTKSGRRMGNF